MTTLQDKEFGEITISRSRLSRNAKLSLRPDGTLRINLPTYAPLFLAKRLVSSSRTAIRQLMSEQTRESYYDGMQVGKSHSLQFIPGDTLQTSRQGQRIFVTIPATLEATDPTVQVTIKKAVIQALRREAKSYLPKRLNYLATRHGLIYNSVRFSHASSRWGSCSSNGTISLNIALMTLSFTLIDYVLLHELAHTREMNHSPAFWRLLESFEPDFKTLRDQLKAHSPHI